NGPLLRTTVAHLRQRKARTSFQKVKGHSGNTGNDGADALAGRGAKKPLEDIIDMHIPVRLVLPGAKLRIMSQSLAYKIIKQKKMSTPAYQKALNRRATRQNMAYVKGAAAGPEGESPPESRVWNSIRHKDLPRNIRYFLWMLIHDGYKVGNHWTKIPGFEHQGVCQKCGVTETMEHILTKCEARGQGLIWKMTSELWKKKTGAELRPTVGEIMACGTIQRGDAGTSRLFRILVSESAHLIWKLRNERVIQEKGEAPGQEIRNRWLRSINNRIAHDRALTNREKYGKKGIDKKLVQRTWTKVIENESKLPLEWMRDTEVLVGIG
ncbi:hypothetical protein C8R43DRAFT_1192432, partial [Mycena crocata]